MQLGLDLIPPDEISHMSLNGLRTRVATRDKNQIGTSMDESSVALDLEKFVSYSGAPPLSFIPMKNYLLDYL
jgi:hypothetical protein